MANSKNRAVAVATRKQEQINVKEARAEHQARDVKKLQEEVRQKKVIPKRIKIPEPAKYKLVTQLEVNKYVISC